MQGHLESPCLWEQHADAILKSIGFEPTIHEPCLYSGTIYGANIVWDMIDDQLSIPLKRQGLAELYNGLDVVQSRHCIKLNWST